MAKERGLTDGSYEKNIALLNKLKNTKDAPTVSKEQESSANIDTLSFNEAFKIKRQQLGKNQIFEYKGKKFSTNLAGEKFEPSEAVLSQNNMNTEAVKSRLKEEVKKVESEFTAKSDIEVAPTMKPWQEIKQRQEEYNKMSQADIIKGYKAEADPDKQYLIVDKKNARMHLYKGDEKIDSFEIGTGQSEGDTQTKTVVKDGKVDWDAGNKTTGAGKYTINNVNEFKGAPSFTLKNENEIEVPTVIHATLNERKKYFGNDNIADNRMSYGCVNGQCEDLKELRNTYNVDKGTEVFVLPEEEGNSFEISNNKLIFKSSNPDVNRTVETLNYVPIEIKFDEESFRNEKFSALDFNDEEELETKVKPYIKALEEGKQQIMKIAKVNGDIYNEIAQVAFGIFGVEGNYGDDNTTLTNVGKGIYKKFINPSAGAPDTEFESSWRKNEDIESKGWNSLGLTQVVWKQTTKEERDKLKQIGINKIEDFDNAKKAAKGTAMLLALRYNNEIKNKKEGELPELLSRVWNKDKNYPKRVKEASRFINLYQLD